MSWWIMYALEAGFARQIWAMRQAALGGRCSACGKVAIESPVPIHYFRLISAARSQASIPCKGAVSDLSSQLSSPFVAAGPCPSSGEVGQGTARLSKRSQAYCRGSVFSSLSCSADISRALPASIRQHMLHSQSGSQSVPHVQSSLTPSNSKCQQQRSYAKQLKPKHVGRKLRTYSSLKERFKMTGSGKYRRFPAGHRHKRTPKSAQQNRRLGSTKTVHPTWGNIMKRLGHMRRAFA